MTCAPMQETYRLRSMPRNKSGHDVDEEYANSYFVAASLAFLSTSLGVA
jgi:hypothetical protein